MNEDLRAKFLNKGGQVLKGDLSASPDSKLSEESKKTTAQIKPSIQKTEKAQSQPVKNFSTNKEIPSPKTSAEANNHSSRGSPSYNKNIKDNQNSVSPPHFEEASKARNKSTSSSILMLIIILATGYYGYNYIFNSPTSPDKSENKGVESVDQKITILNQSVANSTPAFQRLSLNKRQLTTIIPPLLQRPAI